MLRINFALESAALTPEALRDLDQVAAALLDPRLMDVSVVLEPRPRPLPAGFGSHSGTVRPRNSGKTKDQ